MSDLPEACQSCGKYTTSSSETQSCLKMQWLQQGNQGNDIDVLVVLDQPTYTEFNTGCVGSEVGTYDYLKQRFQLCMPQANVAITAVVRCQGDYVKKQWELCSKAFLTPELKMPKVVMGTGALTYRALFGGAKAASTVWLDVRRVPDSEAFYLTIPGPAEFASDPGVEVYINAGFRIATKHLNGSVHMRRYTDEEHRFEGTDYRVLRSQEEFKQGIDYLSQFSVLTYDLETTGISPYGSSVDPSDLHNDRIISLAVSYGPGKAFVFLLHHKDNPHCGQSWIDDEMRRLFTLPNVEWGAHNGKFDSGWLWTRLGVDVFTQWDTMLMHGLLDENTPHGLKLLAQLYTDLGQYEQDLDKHMPPKGPQMDGAYERCLPLDLMLKYNCADADVTFRLLLDFKASLEQTNMLPYYQTFVRFDNWATGVTERNGVVVDFDRIDEVSKDLLGKIEHYRSAVYDNELFLRYCAWREQDFIKTGLFLYEDEKLYRNSEDMAKGKVMWDPATMLTSEDEYHKVMHKWLVDQKVIRSTKRGKGKQEGKPFLRRIYVLQDCRLNLNASAQLREILHGDRFLNLPTDRKTPKGGISVDAKALKALAGKAPFVNDLLEYRKVSKLYGTYNARYTQGWVTMTNLQGKVTERRGYVHGDGLLHPVYLITGGNDYAKDDDEDDSMGGTRTRRKSAIDPNITNQPKRGDKAKLIQSYYTSRYGDAGLLVQFDYSQVELRVFAINAQSHFMLNSFNEGKDLHLEMATECFASKYMEDLRLAVTSGTLSEQVYECACADVGAFWKEFHTGDEAELASKYRMWVEAVQAVQAIGYKYRTKVKPVWFGMIYGAGYRTVAEEMEVPDNEAKAIMATVFDRIPEYEGYKNQVELELEQSGMVMSMVGALRHLPLFRSADSGLRAKALRQGGNFKIQSTASDMLTASWILSQRWLQATKLAERVHHTVSVHDSLLFDCHKSAVPYVMHGIPAIMENLDRTPCGNFWFLNEQAVAARNIRTCPIIADCEMGSSWAKIKDIGKVHDWCGGKPTEVFAEYANTPEVQQAYDMLQTFVTAA